MLNSKDVKGPLIFSKNLVTEQTYTGLTKKNNIAAIAFDATEGLGTVNTGSSVMIINFGGMNDQKITADLKYQAPTAAGNEDIGVILRMQSFDSPSQHYYYARVSGQNARITKVLSGSFTNLTSTAFTLAQDTIVTITFSAVGNALSATFSSATGTPAITSISAADTAITGDNRGTMAFRSQNSSIWCRSFTCEQK